MKVIHQSTNWLLQHSRINIYFPVNCDLFFLWLTFWVFANLHLQNSQKFSKFLSERSKTVQIFFNWVNIFQIDCFMKPFLVSGVCQCGHKWILRPVICHQACLVSDCGETKGGIPGLIIATTLTRLTHFIVWDTSVTRAVYNVTWRDMWRAAASRPIVQYPIPALKFLCDAVTETGAAIRVTKDFLALTMSQSTKR